MTKPVIKIQNLSKVYRLGEVGTGTLSHDLNRFWRMNILGQEDPYAKVGQVNDRTQKAAKGEHISALNDINLEVQQGEVLGIIGKNGAGKSTLLKLLSRVTSPTTGTIQVKGRMASLLEVGTGFHPEMTGRENIYMNGTIMGMRKWEIARKLDEIVEFAGVAKYLDTPTKRYSSGMTVRLGFAIAAHLEPEILVVDEVLAVGDAEFQKKAIGKMQEVSSEGGRTVLFVSHNMASVKTLCTKGIILENGFKTLETDIDSCVGRYLKGDNDLTNHRKWTEPVIKNHDFELLEIGIRAKGKDYADNMRIDEELEFTATFKQHNPGVNINITLHIKDEQGTKLFSTGSSNVDNESFKTKGIIQVKGYFPANFFNWGNFYIDVYVVENRKRAIIIENDLISFTLVNKEMPIGVWMGKEPGSIKPQFNWQKSVL
ncbi:ABC transporter ATP-binding protein [Alkalitalea saponilacus]|uniref:Lipopolysaccharide transport system ATP-binding protein n=1 Tax=Alkalitalea saponilacus TaxID=889453 RepID=A0A1T5H0J0_9BACT|nr:ABC transporter ATP-binding protein [Alkalitalea saponilacus]ASB50949.1 ABC transporter ATP-binding protein [Alkalitalea saponilacus]SKC14192.1 lipopolysaccharide transport system ATP-binding protein [Alkalitalea saponilacus]